MKISRVNGWMIGKLTWKTTTTNWLCFLWPIERRQVRRRDQRVRAEPVPERGDVHRPDRHLPVQLHRRLHGQRLREAEGGDVRQLAVPAGRVLRRLRPGDAVGQQLHVPVSLRLPGTDLRHGDRLLRLAGALSERRHLHAFPLRARKSVAWLEIKSGRILYSKLMVKCDRT